MKLLLFILTCVVLLGCNDSNKNTNVKEYSEKSKFNNFTQIDLDACSNYSDFLEVIDSMICNQKEKYFLVNKRNSIPITIRSINRCSNISYISCEMNLLGIYNKEIDSVLLNINRDDQIIVNMIKNFIINPFRLENKAAKEKKVGLRFSMDKLISLEKVYLILKKLDRCYQISRQGTKAPEVMHLYFDYYWLIPPPPPPVED